tara:strand:+ start:624 stop:1238 length:615 start_codon:yes stop_codon:yes gene_type:complete
MEETAIITSEEKAMMIKLPEGAVKGLAPINILMMKQAAVDVNESWAVAGNAIKASCETLYNLKRNVKRGNWTAFIKSGVLNISAKTASDLVNVYDKWLVYSDDVPDSLLSTMSPRTLSAVANTDEKTRNKILSKVMTAAKTSESDVRKIIKDATPNKAKLMIETRTDDDLEKTDERGVMWKAYDKRELVAKILMLKKEIAKLKA